MNEYTITFTKVKTLMVWADNLDDAIEIYKNNPENCIDRGESESIYFEKSEE